MPKSKPEPTPTLRLAHSPDSDDLVMWWPLTGMHGPDGAPVEGELGTPRVDTEGLAFELIGEDVEALNAMVVGEQPGNGQWAMGNGRETGEDPLRPAARAASPAGAGEEKAIDITAISAAAYPGVADRWRITRCGGSFGEGYGPKVVVREDSAIREPHELRGKRIAVPGTRTSAFRTLGLLLTRRGNGPSAMGHGAEDASGSAFEHEAMLFSDVPGAVVDGRYDAGLLIHEAQLTFGELGLRAVVDLGAWWTGETGLPLPLGLNVVRRDLDARFGPGTVEKVGRVLTRSVAYATTHAEESRRYLLLHAGDRTEWHDAALVEKYLAMYVSRMSLDMGERGVEALRRFLGDGPGAGVPMDVV